MKQRTGLILLGLLLFPCSVNAQSGPTLSGTVSEKGTGRPLEGAKVAVVGGKANSESTDSKGGFVLRFPAEVRVGDLLRIHIELDGYIPYTDTLAVVPAQPHSISLERVKNTSKTITRPDAAKAQPQPPVSAESIRPHLQTRLVIDSIPQDADIEFHIEVENISQLQINGLRTGMRTAEMTSQDVSVPMPPTLPPGGRLSIPGSPVSGLKRYGVLFLDLDYESKVDGKTSTFVSSYSFLVRPVDMRPQALLPTTWQEQAGVILGPEQKTMEAALKTLAGPQGTILIALPLLRPDGSPNLLGMTNNKRKFWFDGSSRAISFTTTTSTGSLKTISHALPDGSYEAIVIGCLWDDQKDEAKLIINGNEFP
jgi:hypothetical protein